MVINPNIDILIESYDVQDDPVLLEHFKPIEEKLWDHIVTYGAQKGDLDDSSHYGDTLSKHLMRTSAIAMQFLTVGLGFSEKAGRNFYDANLFQDLGKTHPDYEVNIWSLPHRPSEEERHEKRLHPERGAQMIDEAIKGCPDILKNHPHIQVIKAIQLYHHGKVAESKTDIGKAMKAICIIDAYDGDMIHRPHQLDQRTPEQALRRLHTGKKYEGAFDPEMLERFIDFQMVEG